ncbi:MAG: hypothetical protein R3B47_13185 [Bacteroidia bacterium]
MDDRRERRGAQRKYSQSFGSGGELELIQLWINLPAAQKMHEPVYQGFQKDEIPAWVSEDKNTEVRVISGSFGGFSGPVDSLTGIRALTIYMKPGASLNIQEGIDQNPVLYQLKGNAL